MSAQTISIQQYNGGQTKTVIAWYWGLVNALLVTFVIWANGKGYRWGWLAGAGAQAWIIAFGLIHGSWPFVFSAIPLMMFARNYHRHDVRLQQLRASHYADFTHSTIGESSVDC